MLQAEKTQACRKMLHQNFPDACLTTNVYNLLEKVPADKKWSLDRLKLAGSVNCETHCQRCGCSKMMTIKMMTMMMMGNLSCSKFLALMLGAG